MLGNLEVDVKIGSTYHGVTRRMYGQVECHGFIREI